MEELPVQYNPAQAERDIYARWTEAGIFEADASQSNRNGGTKTPFTIVMPPPNVTAVLHMGHGLNNTVQDVVTRWRRMAGDETLWLPGTDHAGIATQNVVEKLLAKEGKTRFDLGRDKFVNRTAEFVEETGGTILNQLRAIGASCDWSRTSYTLSEDLSEAVREAFVQLYERGLIYRGHRVIHWCTRCLTSLSDEEAEHTDENGKLYHIAYQIADNSGSLTVATTRPETLLGDVAVAVNPEDERYKHLIGKEVILPLNNVHIPVIADEYTKPEFGTGVVKITPAHDPNDFEVGTRHKLPMPVIMTPEGTMQDGAESEGRVPERLRGVDRFEARRLIVEELKNSGQLVKVEEHQHAVRHCYRCDTVVEPRLSDQWFVKMKPLAEPALEAVRNGTVRILPERWEAVYVNWLENIRDWNISRQLWWGHRVPVWYCDKGHITVSRHDVTECSTCNQPVKQDEDVLDTWFSSWLWPFSTLGWPNKNSADLKAFYPTDQLITAPEILFFWVARMIMAGYAFMDKAPFHTVYLHGTVRDTNHVKMSKSLGNGIDPLDVVGLYGADALRWTVVSGMGMGADLILDPKDLEKSFSTGRNFATKLWNIGRFLLTNLGDAPVKSLDSLDRSKFTRADNWILSRADAAISDCNSSLGPSRPNGDRWDEAQLYAGLRLNEYAETARRFVWNELADWYLESVKSRVQSNDLDDREIARSVLVYAFDTALRLLHPIVPFVTETLWQRLPESAGKFLANADWPKERKIADAKVASDFEVVREAVMALRQLRADYAIAPGKPISATVAGKSAEAKNIIAGEAELISRFARTTIDAQASADSASAHLLLSNGAELIVPLAGIVDVAKECDKLKTELAQLDKQLSNLTQRLANESFVSKAPANVIEGERQKQRDWTARKEQLQQKVKSLCGV